MGNLDKQEYYKVYDDLGNLHLVTPCEETARKFAIKTNLVSGENININLKILKVFL